MPFPSPPTTASAAASASPSSTPMATSPPPTNPSSSADDAVPDPDPDLNLAPAHTPLSQLTTTASSRRPPPPCWSQEETVALIECYRDRWIALHRGNLRSDDWSAVASSLFNRCPSAPAKTSLQCRHKIEKLRKRFRSERHRSRPSNWVLYPLLSSLEPTIHPPPPPRPPTLPSAPSEDKPDKIRNTTGSSLHKLLPLRFTIPKASSSNPNTSKPSQPTSILRKRSSEDASKELVEAIRLFGEGILRMETKRMEAARDMERLRMEMELRRTQMVLDAQRMIVDAFVNEIVGVKRKRTKVPS